jgi:hypothetical protein
MSLNAVNGSRYADFKISTNGDGFMTLFAVGFENSNFSFSYYGSGIIYGYTWRSNVVGRLEH